MRDTQGTWGTKKGHGYKKGTKKATFGKKRDIGGHTGDIGRKKDKKGTKKGQKRDTGLIYYDKQGSDVLRTDFHVFFELRKSNLIVLQNF